MVLTALDVNPVFLNEWFATKISVSKLFWVGRETIWTICAYLFLTLSTSISVLKAVFLVNVFTSRDREQRLLVRHLTGNETDLWVLRLWDFHEKLPDQPDKIVFLTVVSYREEHFANWKILRKTRRKFKFTRSSRLIQCIRAIRESQCQIQPDEEVRKCTGLHVYLHLIKSQKWHIRYIESCPLFCLYLYLWLLWCCEAKTMA